MQCHPVQLWARAQGQQQTAPPDETQHRLMKHSHSPMGLGQHPTCATNVLETQQHDEGYQNMHQYTKTLHMINNKRSTSQEMAAATRRRFVDSSARNTE